MKCWTNGTVTLQYSATKIRYTVRHSKPYTSDIMFNILLLKMIYDNINM